jgi:DNA-binding CsgD family transcriptional regulator/dipeptidyl aminopeptidase/acylaminoacyl peptidase
MRRGRPPHPELLTPREQEVFALLRQGLTNEEIGRRLGISLDGAKYHVSEILSKLGVSSRREAAQVSLEPSQRRGLWASLPLFLRRGTSSTLVKVAAAGVISAAVVALSLLLLGLIEMSGRSYDLEATPIVWVEATLPGPALSELANPWLDELEDDARTTGLSDVWQVYAMALDGDPALLYEGHRRSINAFWQNDGQSVSVVYTTRLRGTGDIGPRGGDPYAMGLMTFDVSTSSLENTWPLAPSLGIGRSSPDGRYVMVRDAVNANNAVYIHEVGGDTMRMQPIGPNTSLGHWSPDARSFTFSTLARTPTGEPASIYYYTSVGADRAYLLGVSRGGHPTWSPDGRYLALTETDTLVVADVRSGKVKRLPLGGETFEAARWSPDGRFVTVEDAVVEVRSQRLLYPVAHGTQDAQVSQDGHTEAYIRSAVTDDYPCRTGPVATQNQTWLREIRTGEERLLFGCDDGLYTSLTWLDDGRLIFSGAECVSCHAHRFRVEIVSTGGRIEHLTRALEVGADYFVAPDGERLLVTGEKLRVYGRDGTLEREIAAPPGMTILHAAWSADGQNIAYIVGPYLQLI